MDTRSMLDQFMQAGRGLLQKGEDAAAQRLGVGDDPEARGQMRNAALGGAAGAAALGLLLGTSTGRSLGRAGLLAGGVGLLGKLAYDAYAKTTADAAPPVQQQPVAQLSGSAADDRAQALLAALVAAAKADGHVSDDERAMIEAQTAALGADAQALIAAELSRPMDAGAIAAMCDGDQARREVYALSVMVCGGEHPMERAWLQTLAAALALPAAVTAEIEAQVAAA